VTTTTADDIFSPERLARGQEAATKIRAIATSHGESDHEAACSVIGTGIGWLVELGATDAEIASVGSTVLAMLREFERVRGNGRGTERGNGRGNDA
jgi:hypothetical protein